MALPIIQSPKYDIRIPSTGKSIQYRPFLVKEEKILLIAQESGSTTDMINAMKDIISACTFNKVDPNELTTYDLEYLFLKLRSKSVGETATVKIKCNSCDEHVEVEINIDDIPIPKVDKDPVKILLSDNVGVIMRHVRVRDLDKLTKEQAQSDTLINTIIASIESIYDEKNIHQTDESTHEELVEFINSLSRSHMKKIEEYIKETPKIEHTIKFKCSNGHENEVTLSGVKSFFG